MHTTVARARPAGWKRAEPFVMLAALELAYLQYFYVDVMSTIVSMRSLVVFVFPS